MNRLLAAAVVGSLLYVAPVRAQEPLTRNDFEIDGYTGPVLGSGRIVGLGGAHAALASGIDAAPWNPAAYGVREPYELDWFEYGLTAGVLLPGLFAKNDYFNNGQGEGIGVDNFVFVDVGFRLQFGRAGVGGVFQLQSFEVQDAGRTVNVQLLTGHYGGAWMFGGGQLVVGGGARTASMNLTLADGTTLVSFTGTGAEVGAVLALEDRSWRLGAALRTPVSANPRRTGAVTEAGGVRRVGAFVLPRQVHLPWEGQLGFAWQIGDRPLNLRWEPARDPEPHLRRELEQRWCWRRLAQVRREYEARGERLPDHAGCPFLTIQPEDARWLRDEAARRREELKVLEARLEREEERIEERREAAIEALPRNYWLLSTGLLLVGRTDDGVGLDAFIDQERRPAGRSLSVGIRLGIETEPWEGWLKTRAGFYLEPSRKQGVAYRPHGTLGFDVRLFSWDLFGLVEEFTMALRFTTDLAPRYYDFGVGLIFWH